LDKIPVHFNGITYSINDQKDTIGFNIPFTKAGNLIVVKAKVDSVQGNFIIDSGNPGLVLNQTYFRNYKTITDTESGGESNGINGTVSNVEQIIISEFVFGKLLENQLKADLLPLGHIENARKLKIIGLIGIKFFSNCEVIFDFENSTLQFTIINKKFSKNYKNRLIGDTNIVKILPFTITDNRLIVQASIANKKLKFIIDCAAETNILHSKLPNIIFDKLNVLGKTLLTGIGSNKIEAIQGEIEDLTIGNKKLSNLPFIVTNLEKTCFSYLGCVDGVLGFDFLSLQKIGFNFTNNQMYIWQ
jgi:hypothetical protein